MAVSMYFDKVERVSTGEGTFLPIVRMGGMATLSCKPCHRYIVGGSESMATKKEHGQDELEGVEQIPKEQAEQEIHENR